MIVESITVGLLSSIIYDIIKASGSATFGKFKASLRERNLSEQDVDGIANLVPISDFDDEMSERAIEKQLAKNEELLNFLSKLKITEGNVVNQVHYGSGDNIAGDKYTS